MKLERCLGHLVARSAADALLLFSNPNLAVRDPMLQVGESF
jgi:hypothetical protein